MQAKRHIANSSQADFLRIDAITMAGGCQGIAVLLLTSITGEDYIRRISVGKEGKYEKNYHPIGRSCFCLVLDSVGPICGPAIAAKFQDQSPG